MKNIELIIPKLNQYYYEQKLESIDFFNKIDPNFNDDTKVKFEIFDVIKKLSRKEY